MSEIQLSGLDEVIYDEKKYGIWGTLGSGAGCDVHFIQMVLTARDLDNIKLISDIPESKKWSIKDLFQRNINRSRVDGQLMEYLNDTDRIKFFNPITLILLPHNSKNEIIKDVPFLHANNNVKDIGLEFEEREYSKYYKLGFNDSLGLGKFEWNKDGCFVVAIDGQHRLSALKKLKQSGNSSFMDWKIPAVLLCIHKQKDEPVKVKLLEAVRRVFIDINNKAERITNARKILLNDALLLDVVSQEIIEFAHSSKDDRRVPLVFFDWRGDQDKGRKSSLASVVTVEEINNILKEYFDLPEEGAKKTSLPNWMANASIPEGELSYKSSKVVRSFINEQFVPGLHVFLKNIDPYKNYLESLEGIFSTENGRYCFEKDAYDTVDVFEQDKEAYYYAGYSEEIDRLKSSIPKLLSQDIGLRAVLYVYSNKKIFDKIYKEKQGKTNVTWEDHGKEVAKLINKLILHGWFVLNSSVKTQYKYLTGIVETASGGVVNYKINEVPKAYGALLLRLSINLLDVKPEEEIFTKTIEYISDELRATYLKEFKKQKRAELAPTWTKTNKELNKEVQKHALKSTESMMNEMEKFLAKYDVFADKYEK